MGVDDLAGDGEAKPGAAGVARTGFVDAVEAVEDVGESFGGNALAGVAQLDCRALVRARDGQVNSPAGVGVLDCVVGKDYEQFVETCWVTVDFDPSVDMRLEVD